MEKKKPGKFTLKSRIGSFRYAFNGLSSLLKNEHNSRIHLVAAFIAISVAILLKISLSEWSLLIIAIGIVFVSEIINSAIETFSDLIDTEFNESIKRVKDYTAAAVLISAFIAVAVGCIIFIPKIIALKLFSST
jgi:diacylglycerol kinase (ATP)